jgi:hypothetical protein
MKYKATLTSNTEAMLLPSSAQAQAQLEAELALFSLNPSYTGCPAKLFPLCFLLISQLPEVLQ